MFSSTITAGQDAPPTELGLSRLMSNPDIVLLYKVELRACLHNRHSRLLNTFLLRKKPSFQEKTRFRGKWLHLTPAAGVREMLFLETPGRANRKVLCSIIFCLLLGSVEIYVKCVSNRRGDVPSLHVSGNVTNGLGNPTPTEDWGTQPLRRIVRLCSPLDCRVEMKCQQNLGTLI